MLDDEVRRVWSVASPWEQVPDASGCYHMRAPHLVINPPYPLRAFEDEWSPGPGRAVSWMISTPAGCQHHAVQELMLHGFTFNQWNRHVARPNLWEVPRPAFIDTGIVACDAQFSRCTTWYVDGHSPFMKRRLIFDDIENPCALLREFLSPLWIAVPFDDADQKRCIFVSPDLCAIVEVTGTLLTYQVCTSMEDLLEKLAPLSGFSGLSSKKRPPLFSKAWMAGGWTDPQPSRELKKVLRELSRAMGVYSPRLLQAMARILIRAPLPVSDAIKRLTTMVPRVDPDEIENILFA